MRIPAFRPGGKRILGFGAAKRRSPPRSCFGSGQGLAVMRPRGVRGEVASFTRGRSRKGQHPVAVALGCSDALFRQAALPPLAGRCLGGFAQLGQNARQTAAGAGEIGGGGRRPIGVHILRSTRPMASRTRLGATSRAGY